MVYSTTMSILRSYMIEREYRILFYEVSILRCLLELLCLFYYYIYITIYLLYRILCMLYERYMIKKIVALEKVMV